MDRLGSRIVLAWGWRRAALAFLAGALLVLAQAPYDFFAVGFVSFPILIWLLDGATSEAGSGRLAQLRLSFGVGWWFGFGYFVAGLWWIGNALLVEADSFAWALPLAVVALPAVLAIYYGLAAVLARLFWSESIGRIAMLAFAFALAEWLRGHLFTGFPWNAIGYAAMPVPTLMQSSVLMSIVGMNALTVFVFAMPALVLSRRGRRLGFALAAILIAAHVGFGLFRLSQADLGSNTLPVRLVQPSILQNEKWDREARDRIFGTYLEMSAAAPAEGKAPPSVIIWPETAVPFILNDRPDALSTLGDLLADGQTLLAGAVRSEASPGGATRYYNSMLSIDDAGQIVDAIDKVHLVPFGEYLPFSGLLHRFGISKIVVLPEDFSSAQSRPGIKLPGGLSAVAFICYEIIFDEVVRKDAAGKDILINLTNDAWFGDTPGPRQHFRQAQLRAVETGLPLVRAANSGISGVVDGFGRIVDAYAINGVGTLDVAVPTGKGTILRLWDPVWAGWIVLAMLAAGGISGNFRARSRH
ncbi:apolipoprotein N-acyltransferase [Tianweitania sp. BSSL-BM11]|uniref:Apolipoprotein N-acyltransferase n=1 Tax=Tianweitania aestuarii TaxID=2814886 RepID=A0ABS5RQ93_9HYPH|nr:apolipoprotein N-acyltransferase [Tianweitania aestuarii]MBS9719211.1 apolipoprotein N-acyltransferase [Tianweitania aestuarii]